MSYLAVLDNRTPFEAAVFVMLDPRGQEATLIVLSASFEAVDERTGLELAASQRPIRVADVAWGDPASSSIRYENDLALFKPFVDVLVNGRAYAPGRVPTRRVVVELRVADIRKTLVVHGERTWVLWEPTRGLPFETMPIRYERAFGGLDRRGRVDGRNPVGVGLGGSPSPSPVPEGIVANVEFARAPLTRLGSNEPAGFGALGRGWAPRIGLAGTYDQRWLESRWPLLPEDFDPRHNQAAPEDQQSRSIRGGEPVALVNMTPSGVWRFRVPQLDVPVHLLFDDRQEQAQLRLDTILIEPDDGRVELTARLAVTTRRTRGVLREIVLGHVRRGWLRARSQRKLYIDHLGHDGTDLRRTTYVT